VIIVWLLLCIQCSFNRREFIGCEDISFNLLVFIYFNVIILYPIQVICAYSLIRKAILYVTNILLIFLQPKLQVIKIFYFFFTRNKRVLKHYYLPSVQNYICSCTVNVVAIFSFITSLESSLNFDIYKTVSTGMYSGVDIYVDKTKEFCLKFRQHKICLVTGVLCLVTGVLCSQTNSLTACCNRNL
jgi:hypothetical protein